jgi:hypothetical protein
MKVDEKLNAVVNQAVSWCEKRIRSHFVIRQAYLYQYVTSHTYT